MNDIDEAVADYEKRFDEVKDLAISNIVNKYGYSLLSIFMFALGVILLLLLVIVSASTDGPASSGSWLLFIIFGFFYYWFFGKEKRRIKKIKDMCELSEEMLSKLKEIQRKGGF